MTKLLCSKYLRGILLALPLIAAPAVALTLDEISNRDVSTGLKAALEKCSSAAVARLGVPNGFLGNEQVKIHLPKILEEARPLMRLTGHAQQLDDLETEMNHAAESAVPLAKPLLINAVKSMTFSDAKKILTGGETSVTAFFREKTSMQLGVKFLPIVKSITDRSGLSREYGKAMSRVSRVANVPPQQASVEAYVTQRALDGLFYMIGEEEKAIRSDPIGTGSTIIKKVFGSLQ